MQKNTQKMHFFAKIFGHIKKKQYLCTRFRKESTIDQWYKGYYVRFWF